MDSNSSTIIHFYDFVNTMLNKTKQLFNLNGCLILFNKNQGVENRIYRKANPNP